MNENSKKKVFNWKGKRVTEKVYNLRVRQVKVGKNLRSVYGCKKEKANLKESATESNNLEGRRIVHLKTLFEHIFYKCQKCDTMVPLNNTVDEERIGLASIFTVQCENCRGKIRFAIDKKHQVKKQCTRTKARSHYDVNTRAAMGALNAGVGNTHINKILASLNIPPLYINCYKTHETEVGTVAEEMARESCIAATLMERELSIQNVDKLRNLL
ncbi:hypothetical protein PV327_002948 [Microctonus hyperodae]|uniref:Mutator-like transposase domain-containing protein n=1 Tax=Microctonus hyperodae TaxID=165561 RepID=A0AA39L0M7_MICHY|nr:hypothetical protein PV327_002948 [Microctonus hyperodae]